MLVAMVSGDLAADGGNFCGAAQGLRSTFSCGAAGTRGLGGGWTSLMWWLWDVRRRLSRNAVGAHV